MEEKNKQYTEHHRHEHYHEHSNFWKFLCIGLLLLFILQYCGGFRGPYYGYFYGCSRAYQHYYYPNPYYPRPPYPYPYR
jgi:hypothetical protein